MNRYYECHITIRPHTHSDRKKIKEAVEQTDWKFSCIDGDPILGDGALCYATRHYKNSYSVIEITRWLKEAAKYFTDNGCAVIRKKIECVVFDEREAA